MKLTDRSVSDLLDAFRSSEPTPGGGSASALAGAIGGALLAMVAALPKPRAATEEDAERLAAAGARCRQLSEELAQLVDRDAEAYAEVVSAYRLPKDTDGQKRERSGAIQTALTEAIEAPLSVMRACAAAIEQGVVIAGLGNPSASSDVRVGLELLGAGLRGAGYNVAINLDTIKDAEYARKVRNDVAEFERGAAHESAAALRALSGSSG